MAKKKRKKPLLIRWIWRTIIVLIAIVIAGLLILQNLQMPVVGADHGDYNHNTFWHKGWGKSIVHKGVDVFAKKGTVVNSSTIGIVLSTTQLGRGGKTVLILGPKWRLHYYAHLDKITTHPLALVGHKTQIGTVGNTGNAVSTPAHLHYSIYTLIPYPWRIDNEPLGYKKMFYLNPIDYF